MSVGGAAVAMAGAYALGASWPLVTAAGLLWAGGAFAKGILRILLLLGAPVLLAASIPGAADPLRWAGMALVALAALAPLVIELGPRWLSPRAALIAGGIVFLSAVVLVTQPGQYLLESDLATGAFVGVVAAATLAVVSVAR